MNKATFQNQCQNILDVSIPQKSLVNTNEMNNSCFDFDSAFVKYYKVINSYEKEEIDNLLEYLVRYGQDIARPLLDSEIESFISRLAQNTFIIEIKGQHRDVFNLLLPFFRIIVVVS